MDWDPLIPGGFPTVPVDEVLARLIVARLVQDLGLAPAMIFVQGEDVLHHS